MSKLFVPHPHNLYLTFKILGGVLADKYGGERVMTVSGLIWSLATFSHPILLSFADTSSHQVKLYLLIVLRVVTGFFQGAANLELKRHKK